MLRIVGGSRRGRRLHTPPGRATRPLSDRAREAVFNILGPTVEDRPVFDLFAGTGALGLEALSRGAHHAVFVESRSAIAKLVRRNAAGLDFADRAAIVRANVFTWIRAADFGSRPALIFVAPPYAFYRDRWPQMRDLLLAVAERAPPGTILVLDLDAAFDSAQLPWPGEWDLRRYGKTRIGIIDLPPAESTPPHRQPAEP